MLQPPSLCHILQPIVARPAEHWDPPLGFVLTPFVRLQLSLQVFRGHIEILVGVVPRPRFTPSAAAVTAATQTATEVAAGRQAAGHEQSLQVGTQGALITWRGEERTGSRSTCSYLRPPAGQHKVGVDVLFSKLLRHVQPQRAILIVDVALRGVVQDGVCVVDLLELVRRLGIVGVLVGVELQRQLPAQGRGTGRTPVGGWTFRGNLKGGEQTPHLYDLLMSSLVATFSTPSTW